MEDPWEIGGGRQGGLVTWCLCVCVGGVLHLVWALYHVHIVVEVTMDMAEYTVIVVVNFEPIIRGLKNENFDWNQV